MDKIRIRQKIKELRELLDDHNYYLDNSEQALGYSLALDDIEKFLNTLSEEPDKSLEDAAKHYAYIDWSSDEDIFAFEIKKYDAFKAGAEWKEQQMLRDALEGYVDKDHIVTEGPFYYIRSRNLDLPNGFKEGDKVRIVVLKEEEE